MLSTLLSWILFFFVAGIGFPDRSFQQQAGIPAQIVAMTLEVTHIHCDQCRAVRILGYAQVAVNVVDGFFPMMKGVPKFRRVMSGGEAVDETGAYPSFEVSNRIIIGCLAILEHFSAGEISMQIFVAGGNRICRG